MTSNPATPAAGGPLAGKSAIVTGSTSGIGLGVAEALAAAGVDVLLNGFGDAAAIEEVQARLRAAYGVKVGYHGADMSKPAEIADLYRAGEAAFGKVDVIVNNAGIQHVAPVDEFPLEKWDAIVAINMSAVFHLTRAALPGMKARNWGRVINIASAHGLVASPFKSAYVAAKHGVVGFTKSVALEVAETGITVNSICPGYVLTPLVDKQIDDQAKVHNLPRDRVIREVILAAQPNKRFVRVEDLGAMSVFLCSEAGSTITGAALTMDGGWTAR